MQYEIKAEPNFSAAQVIFEDAGEAIVVEAEAMAAKDSDIEMETNTRGGLMQAAKRSVTTGESLMQNTFTATRGGQTMWITPPAEGDLQVMEMDGSEAILIASDNFVASGPDIALDSEWGGAKGFFSGTSLFLARAEGTGPLFVGSYGGIHAVELDDETYTVDNHHIVAFTEGLDYDMQRMGGMLSMVGGDEGYVCRFRGEGTLWLSTRSPDGLARFLDSYRPTSSD